MPVLIVCFLLVFAVTFIKAPALSAGWVWDAGNALGFSALAGVVYLSIPGGPRRDVRAHEWAGYTVVGITIAHGLWFLLADAAMVEYLKPGAPLSMWTGVASLLGLVLLIILAVVPTRLRVHRRYSAFKTWHRGIALVSVATGMHHIIATGFYVHFWLQWLLLAVLVMAMTLATVTSGAIEKLSLRMTPVNPPGVLLATVVACSVFTLARALAE